MTCAHDPTSGPIPIPSKFPPLAFFLYPLSLSLSSPRPPHANPGGPPALRLRRKKRDDGERDAAAGCRLPTAAVTRRDRAHVKEGRTTRRWANDALPSRIFFGHSGSAPREWYPIPPSLWVWSTGPLGSRRGGRRSCCFPVQGL